ncbi:MAG: O-methyltransferase [Clostridiales bacterium]|nr:O-methyltransferase [Clostridiales bacterium]
MPFKTPNKTSEYIRSLMKEETDPIYLEINKYADENFIPVLLPETASFLAQIIRLAKPKKILEIGTAIGYSAQIMLRNSDAQLYTVEVEEKRIDVAKKFFEKAGVSDRVTVFLGDAGEIVPMLTGEYDFIFMDGPKTRYIEYLPYLDKLLKKDGILLCDNVLFNGMLSGDTEVIHKKSSIVVKIEEFLQALYHNDNYVTSVLPVGDGLSLSIKTERNL